MSVRSWSEPFLESSSVSFVCLMTRLSMASTSASVISRRSFTSMLLISVFTMRRMSRRRLSFARIAFLISSSRAAYSINVSFRCLFVMLLSHLRGHVFPRPACLYRFSSFGFLCGCSFSCWLPAVLFSTYRGFTLVNPASLLRQYLRMPVRHGLHSISLCLKRLLWIYARLSHAFVALFRLSKTKIGGNQNNFDFLLFLICAI